MRLDAALDKIGVKIIKQHSPSKASVTLMLRVPASAQKQWAEAVQEFLLSAEKQPKGAAPWALDVSRVYFLDKGSQVVRYLWRVVITGNAPLGVETLGMSLIRTASQGIEVTSMPLIGRIEPQAGSTKGAHSTGVAGKVIAAHFTSGG